MKEIRKYISNSPEDTKKIAKEIIINELNKLFENKKETNEIKKETKNKKTNSKVLNIILNGELAAGKTKFVEGVLELFNMQDQISSPTFSIVNEYFEDLEFKLENINRNNNKNKIENKNENVFLSLNHFDVYRLADEDEFYESGLKEYIYPTEKENEGNFVKINLIEWGLNIIDVFPKGYIVINLKKDEKDLNKRIIEVIEK